MKAKDVYELTNPQKSIWSMEEFFKGSAINNICGSLTIKENVDFKLLEKAVNLYVELNDSFHIRLFIENSIPKQYFCEPEYCNLEIIDINNEDEILNIEKEMVAIPFDIIESPLFKFKLFRLPNGHGGFVVNAHHIISDAATFAILGSSIAKIYADLKNNVEIDKNTPSYKDYILSEQEYLKGDKFKKDEQYWNEQFESIPDIASIPASFRDTTNYSSHSKRESFLLSKSTVDKIRDLCSKEKISIFNFFMAIYSLYIGRVSNLDEFVIGTPILNRSNFREKHTSGMFISTVPLKITIDNDSTFLDFVSKIAQDSLAMLRHQKYPYQYLLENLRNKFGNVPNLYDNLISYQITKTVDKSIDLPYSVHWVESNEISCGINIHIHDNNDSGNLIMSYDYWVDKYSTDDIKATHERVLHIINQLLDNISMPMNDIEIVTPEEKNKILYEFNNTKVDYPKDKTIVDLFEEQVNLHPNDIAVVYENQKLTYKQLDEKSNQLANYIKKYNLPKSSVIGLLLDKSLEMIVSILAVLKTNCAFLPIDVGYPKERIYYMLNDSNCRLLLTTETFSKIFDKIEIIDVSLKSNEIFKTDMNIPCIIESSSNDLAYIMYTSGSTGLPKGVMVSQKSIIRLVKNPNFLTFGKNERILQSGSIVFDACTFEIWAALLNGFELFIIKKDCLLNPITFEKYLNDNQITILWLTAPLFNQLVEEKPSMFNKVKYLLTGGDVLSPKHINLAKNACPNLTIINGYGPTENTTFSTCFTIDKLYEHNIPIGFPISNSTCYIVSSNNQLSPIGIPGELIVGGDGVALGYLNNPKLTKEKFIKLQFSDGTLYKTGDLVQWNYDGSISYIGRMDSQVKIRGFRVELNEINLKILSYKKIKESITIIQNINDEKVICSYIATYDKGNIDIEELKLYLKSSLPSYMIPSHFIELDKLPINTNGKVDKKLLPMPNTVDMHSTKNIVHPRNNVDKYLLDILQKILNCNNISISENLLYLGLDSLNSIKLISYISEKYNVNISISDILENPCIEYISDKIVNMSVITRNKISQTTKKDYYLASCAQKRIYYSSNIAGKNSIVYNVPGGIIMEKIPDINKLENCFNKLIQRHESLRTYFDIVDGNVVQEILDNIDFKLNISSANYKDLDKCFKNFVKPFNLNTAPLFRAELVKFENDKCLLLFDMHHIICDGTSLQIFIKELCSLYNNETLTNVTLTYKDFAVWENDNLKGNTFNNSKKYWISQFKDDVPVLNLPTNYPRPVNKSYSGAKIYDKINKDITEKINNYAKANGFTPYMLLLSAYYILLSKYSMQDDIIIGSPIAARDNSQLADIIGMFVNTLPLRMNVNNGYTFKDFLKNVKNMCLNSFEHQTYPLDELINNLNLTRDNSRNPLFDVLFTYQNNGLENLNLGNIHSEYYIPDTKISKFDLSLEVIPTNDELNINFEYCTKLFNKDFVQNICNHYINILNIVLDNPEIKISDIDMLFKEEKNRIVHDFNNTYLEYPSDKNLVDLFKDIVLKYPNNIAVQFGEKSITYKELDEKSNTLAIQMLDNGVKKGDIVGVCINKSIELLISIWAILKNGCVYMPMYVGYPKDRLEYMVKNSNCKLLIINSTMKNIIDVDCNYLDIVGFEKIENTKDFVIKEKILPTDVAYVIYTSGSTGKPKGVKIMHKNLINYIYSFNKLFKNISSKDRFLSSTNISFDVSIWELFLSILNGATLVLYTEELINNIFEYSRNILDYEITALYIPPNILEEIYTILKNSKNIKINKLLVGVEPIKKSTLNRFYELNPYLKVVNG